MKEYPRWDEVPDNLKTKTQLGKLGLRLARGQEAVALKTHWKVNIPDYSLYDIAQAVPKRKSSKAQLGPQALGEAQLGPQALREELWPEEDSSTAPTAPHCPHLGGQFMRIGN